MTPDTFHLRVAAESLKLIRPKLDTRLETVIDEMATTADQLDELPEAIRAELLETMVPAARQLVDALDSLANDYWPDPLRVLEEAV